MANLVSRASGNLTSTTTWKTVETGTRAIQNSFSASTNTTTSNNYNANAQDMTVANLSVIEGLLLYCNRVNTTGTVTVKFSEDSGTTDTRTVTVNASDLPASPSWVFFKFGSTLTGDGGTDYAIGIIASSGGNATFYRDATAANWTHLIVTNQNPASVAAGDVFYIAGELLSAGSGNDFTVTMDSTATTDYGTGTDGTSVNGMEIGKRGTLTWGTTAATNYYLKLSGSLNVWGDGTFNMGTTGTPIPRNSTAILEFDPVADGGMGFYARAGSTVNIQGLSRTSGKNIIACKLNTDEAVNSTSLGVDTDTGWLDNDEIVVVSTTRTATQTEVGTLNGAAGASTLTVDGFAGVGGGLANAHSGTSPTQAEVCLLTRNVKIRSATSTLMTFFYVGTSAIVDIDWAEFRYLGENVTNKRGIEIATSTNGSFDMQYSTLRDCEDWGIYFINASSGTKTISNNVFYRLNTAVGASTAGLYVPSGNGSYTITNNYFVMLYSATFGSVEIANDTVTFTGNLIQGASVTDALRFNDSSNYQGMEDISNTTIHSSAGNGISFKLPMFDNPPGTNPRAVCDNITIWRNSSYGIRVEQAFRNINFNNLLMFGNANANFNVVSNSSTTTRGVMSNCYFNNCSFYADTTFSVPTGIDVSGSLNRVFFNTCDFGTASGIYTTHTRDFKLTKVGNGMPVDEIYLNNCKLSSATEITTAAADVGDIIYSQKHNQTAGLHKTWKKYGIITIDTVTTHTGSQSVKMTPNNASNKLESGSFFVAVANGQTVTPSVYVYEDASYNGARARLILKRNDAIGITSDTVIDTATAASDAAWEQLTGTTASASDDGVMEFVVDCDGTAGNLFVDSFTAT